MDLRRQLFQAVRARNFRNFAHLLDCLLVRERDVRELFLNVAALRLVDQPAPRRARRRSSTPGRTIRGRRRRPRRRRGRRCRRSIAPAMFATNVVNHWTEALRGLSRNADAMQALGVEGRIVDDLVQEVIVGAHRLMLTETIAQGRARARAVGERPLGRCRRSGRLASRRRRSTTTSPISATATCRRTSGPAFPNRRRSRRARSSPRRRRSMARRRWAPQRLPLEQLFFCRLGRGLAPARPRQHQLRRRPRDRRGAEPQARADPRDDRHRAAGSRRASRRWPERARTSAGEERMPARATQPAGYPAGQAQVQVTGVGAADLDTLEVCISGTARRRREASRSAPDR